MFVYLFIEWEIESIDGAFLSELQEMFFSMPVQVLDVPRFASESQATQWAPIVEHAQHIHHLRYGYLIGFTNLFGVKILFDELLRVVLIPTKLSLFVSHVQQVVVGKQVRKNVELFGLPNLCVIVKLINLLLLLLLLVGLLLVMRRTVIWGIILQINYVYWLSIDRSFSFCRSTGEVVEFSTCQIWASWLPLRSTQPSRSSTVHIHLKNT